MAFNIEEIEGDEHLLCLSSNNKLLLFKIEEVKYLKNGGKGVQLIKLDDGCYLKELNIIKEDNFNFNNKVLGKQALQYAEKNDVIVKEQHGSRPEK